MPELQARDAQQVRGVVARKIHRQRPGLEVGRIELAQRGEALVIATELELAADDAERAARSPGAQIEAAQA